MSGHLRYRLHFMHDWRGGTRGMSFELQGAYNDICDEITIQEGPARLDLQEMARRGGTNARAVKRLIDELVERGKLIAEDDGRYRNGRANRDVESALAALAAKGQVSPKHDSRQSNAKTHVSPKHSAKHSAKHEKSLAETLPETLGETTPENIVNSTEDPSYARVNDRARRSRAPRALSSLQKGGGAAIRSGEAPAAQPTSEVSSSASEARKKNGSGNGDNLPRRRTSEWDMPSAPGPTGQTKFLQAEAAFQAGDKAALDPLPGVPWAGAGAYSINGRNLVRRQLGMPPLEEIHETELPTPPADQDDDAVIRGNEQPPSRSSPEADQARARDSNRKTPAPGTGAKHADPGNPNDETEPPLSDEDFGGLA